MRAEFSLPTTDVSEFPKLNTKDQVSHLEFCQKTSEFFQRVSLYLPHKMIEFSPFILLYSHHIIILLLEFVCIVFDFHHHITALSLFTELSDHHQIKEFIELSILLPDHQAIQLF
jgi:hypothetical protein